MTLQIKIEGDREIITRMNNASRSIPDILKTMLEYSAIEVANIMKSKIPLRSGSLSGSVDYEMRGNGMGAEAIIGPDDSQFNGRPVGRATELGRNSGGGFPNYYEIASRYGVPLATGFAIAKSIHNKGTRPGLQYISKTLRQAQGVLLKYGIKAVQEITQKL